jgi:hypothetical protein
VELNQLPLKVGGMGVLWPYCFENQKQWINEIMRAHLFQEIRSTNKRGHFLANGFYATEVQRNPEQGKEEKEGLQFKLLRGSISLVGPTQNLQQVDFTILKRANEYVSHHFRNIPLLNHIWGQLHLTDTFKKPTNTICSDKTQDMPDRAVIGFITFYTIPDGIKYTRRGHGLEEDVFYKNTSVLTQLRFLRKKDAPTDYPQYINVRLLQNSLFIIPLHMNRFYTYSTVAPSIPDHIGWTRVVYVVRTSHTDALWEKGFTWLQSKEKGKEEWHKLRSPTLDEISKLKEHHLEQNASSAVIDYRKQKWFFSLNKGDYLCPILHHHVFQPLSTLGIPSSPTSEKESMEEDRFEGTYFSSPRCLTPKLPRQILAELGFDDRSTPSSLSNIPVFCLSNQENENCFQPLVPLRITNDSMPNK